jgi:hypothetical protein
MKAEAARGKSLEDTLATVRSRRAKKTGKTPPKSGWKAVAGTVSDDPLFREAARLGEEWRKAANTRP